MAANNTGSSAVMNAVESRNGHRGGWSSSFDRLDEHLAKA
jgi:hypothetical protein